MSVLKKKKKTLPKIEYWQELVDHVNETWKVKRRVDYGYPFTGKDFKDLAHYARVYMIWGMMALWDMYLEQADEYTLKRGLDVYTFTRQLPRLLDQNWKNLARQYEDALLPDIAPEVLTLIKQPEKKPAVSQQFKSRLEYLKHKKQLSAANSNGHL